MANRNIEVELNDVKFIQGPPGAFVSGAEVNDESHLLITITDPVKPEGQRTTTTDVGYVGGVTAEVSEAWAVGTRDGVPVTSEDPAYHNNSKYYAELAATSESNASDSADAASDSADAADSSAEDSEAWAVGKRDGVDVGSSDPAYHNNSKYYYDNIGAKTAGVVADWLNKHVDPSTGYVIDDSLTIAGAAADAAVCGEQFNVAKKDLNAVFESGYRYGTISGASINRISILTSSTKECTKVEVKPGCTYEVHYCSYSSAAAPMILFSDVYKIYISGVPSETTRTDMTTYVVAPANAAYMYVNHDTFNTSIVTPSIKLVDTAAYTHYSVAPANEFIDYMSAGINPVAQLVKDGVYQATITNSGVVKTSNIAKNKVSIYAVANGKHYTLNGTAVRLSTTALPIAAFGTTLYDGTNNCQTSIIVIDETYATTPTNYNLIFDAPSDGYLYIASYDDFAALTVSESEYNSQLIENLEDGIKTIIPMFPNDYSMNELFEEMDSYFIDDFTTRAPFVDSDHLYTVLGDDSVPPTITTGVGATRQLSETGTNLFYSRDIPYFPYYCIIGKVPEAAQAIKLYSTYVGGTNYISINKNGVVQYLGITYGNLHINTEYYFLCLDVNGVTIFDDTGVCVTLPIRYIEGNEQNIALGFGGIADRLYGYASFVELVKKPLSCIDVDRYVKYNEIGETGVNIYSIINYTHGVGDGVSTFYKTPNENPATEVVDTDFTNNLCVNFTLDKGEDDGYRTEMAIRPIKSTLHNKIGGLQRIRFSADYYADSSDNVDDNDYYTYIFQIHDSNFSVAGWTDAPPLALRFKNNKLYANVCYISTGAIPQGDNVHNADEYFLSDFEFDKWHHIEVEARIGWKKSLAPRLIVKVDGIERLNILTPIGFNIVSSGGYVNTHCGVYCPQWRSYTYPHMHREILIANVKWEGTQNING